jgi:hypothetical protein
MADIFGWGLGDIELDGYAHLVKKVVILSVTPFVTKIRVVFDRPMLKNSALLNTSNYQIIPPTLDDAQPIINSITTENVTQPTWIEINHSEHTIGKTYQVAFNLSGGITDTELVPLDPSSTPKSYTSVGSLPTIESVSSVGKNLISVKFSETMLEEPTINDYTRYSFDKGLLSTNAVLFNGDTVLITTTDQTPGELYTITITQP